MSKILKQFYLEPEQAKKVKEVAERLDISEAEVIRQIINISFNLNQNPKKVKINE